MPLINRCCWHFSLRIGSLIVAYMGLASALMDLFWILFGSYNFCGKIQYLWLISSGWDIASAVLLLTAVYRNNPNLLPLHLVTCLIGLILEMISHMLLASSEQQTVELVGYGFYAIGFMTADTVIVLSYFQSEM